jgi:protein PhnA
MPVRERAGRPGDNNTVKSPRQFSHASFQPGEFVITTPPPCPLCKMENTYQDGEHYICPDCAHEWPVVAPTASDEDSEVIKDANGNVLQDGDTVVLIKDLKLKGSSGNLKQGTKIKNIRLTSGDHAIDCRIDGVGYEIKQIYVRKA